MYLEFELDKPVSPNDVEKKLNTIGFSTFRRNLPKSRFEMKMRGKNGRDVEITIIRLGGIMSSYSIRIRLYHSKLEPTFDDYVTLAQEIVNLF